MPTVCFKSCFFIVFFLSMDLRQRFFFAYFMAPWLSTLFQLRLFVERPRRDELRALVGRRRGGDAADRRSRHRQRQERVRDAGNEDARHRRSRKRDQVWTAWGVLIEIIVYLAKALIRNVCFSPIRCQPCCTLSKVHQEAPSLFICNFKNCLDLFLRRCLRYLILGYLFRVY